MGMYNGPVRKEVPARGEDLLAGRPTNIGGGDEKLYPPPHLWPRTAAIPEGVGGGVESGVVEDEASLEHRAVAEVTQSDGVVVQTLRDHADPRLHL